MKSCILIPERAKHHGNHVASEDSARYLVLDAMVTDEWKLIPWSGYSVSLSASSTTVTVGNSIVLTATVLDGESSPASGETVTFYNGTTSVYTTTTNSSGVASLTYYAIAPSTLSMTAVCRGVSSDVVTVTVSKITSTISLSAASSSVIVGNDVSLSGTLSVGVGESVKIYQGSSLIDTVTTGTNGAFNKTVSGLSIGIYSFKAVYDGDSTHTDVTSSTVSVTVSDMPAPTITLGASSSTITVGNNVTLSGALKYNNVALSNYSIKIYNGNTLVDTVSTNNSGNYSKTVTGLGVGTYSFTAVFEGDSTYAGVTSTAVSVSVTKITSTISISSSSSSVTVGNTFTISGTLSAGSGCSVKLYEDETLLDTLTTGSGGAFSKTITASYAGTYDYWAKFDGDSTHTSVTSSDVTVTVSDVPVPVPDVIQLTADKSILSYADSESATLTATVLDGNGDGVEGETVTFYKGSTSLGTATTNSVGVATKSYSSTGAGDVSFTATVRSLVSVIFVVHDYLWCPKLDGTETIHQVQNTTTIANGEMYGGSGYIGAFDNTGNWEMTFQAKFSNTSCGIWLIKSDETNRDSNDILFIRETIYRHANGSGEGSPQYPYEGRLSSNTYYEFKLTKNGNTLSIQVASRSGSFTWSLLNTLSTLSVGVDAWGGTSYIKDIVVKPL